ncbi:MAG: hypothetical protein JW999_08010 [Methanotrichaceae archaeon]|nr:hypothetical protein [Methanotrichaceae archaeon]
MVITSSIRKIKGRAKAEAKPIEPRREVKNRVIELGTAREILAEIYGALSRELI